MGVFVLFYLAKLEYHNQYSYHGVLDFSPRVFSRLPLNFINVFK